jgi:YHYH protein
MRFPAYFVKLMVAVGAALVSTAASADTQDARLAKISQFFAGAKPLSAPMLVGCTLSGGTKTQCFSITVKGMPSTYTPGPWCPQNATDGPEVSGIWVHRGEVIDADGAFMTNMPKFYKDPNWKVVDPATGKVNVTGTLQGCQLAANPNPDPAFKNYCVQCLPEYLPKEATTTYVIPFEQYRTWIGSGTNMIGAGVAFNGVRLDGPAPIDRILGAYTIAPFDDCGGHVNPHAGYHYHAVTDCLDKAAPASAHGKEIGIALDGTMIYARAQADGTPASGLDRCNGHISEGIGYHYHAGAPGSNAILGCLSAQYGCTLESPDEACDATKRRRPPQ